MSEVDKAELVSMIVKPLLIGQAVLFLLIVAESIGKLLINRAIYRQFLRKVEAVLLEVKQNSAHEKERREALSKSLDDLQAKQTDIRENLPKETATEVVVKLDGDSGFRPKPTPEPSPG